MSWLVTIASWVCPSYFKIAKISNSVQVISISFSHYCELACWSLKFNGKSYKEQGYAPVQHVFPALSVRVGQNDGKKYLSKSSRTESVKEGNLKGKDLTEEEKKKAIKRDTSARATAVPFAILPSGQVLLDSWEIASYAFAEDKIDPELKSILDTELGPLARRMVYCQILLPKNKDMFNRLCMLGRGWFIRLLWSTFLGGMAFSTMMKMFDVKNEESVRKCREDLVKTVEQLETYLEKTRKGTFLNGDEISFADIALASMFAPLVTPPLYCEGKYNHLFNELMERDDEIRKETNHWRNTKVGQYTLEIYSKYRL
jgi:hypothetical protein